jgi:hypothetical protein
VNAVLAIYDALLQAGVPDAPARRVVEALEQDMTTLLVTKQDLLLIKQDLQHHERLMATRFEAFESRVSLMLQGTETRVVVKLGALMTALFGLAGIVFALLR